MAGVTKNIFVGVLTATVFIIVISAIFASASCNMDVDICIDNGGVWDGDQNICRHDCQTWNKLDGCVPLAKE